MSGLSIRLSGPSVSLFLCLSVSYIVDTDIDVPQVFIVSSIQSQEVCGQAWKPQNFHTTEKNSFEMNISDMSTQSLTFRERAHIT